MREGDDYVTKTSRSSLKLLGKLVNQLIQKHDSNGILKFQVIQMSNCGYLVATETGGILISPQTGAIKLKPGSASKPFLVLNHVL